MGTRHGRREKQGAHDDEEEERYGKDSGYRYRRHGANNFSTNPLIGARMQTGDMRQHPTDSQFHKLALATLSQKSEAMIRVVGEGRYHELVSTLRLSVGGDAGSRLGGMRGSGLHHRLRGAMMRLVGERTYSKLRARVIGS